MPFFLSPHRRRHHGDDGHLAVRKIIRIDTKSVRAAGRATMGVKLLDLDTDDKAAAAMVITPEDPKTPTENGALIQ